MLEYTRENNVVGVTVGLMVRQPGGITLVCKNSVGDNEHMMFLLAMHERMSARVHLYLDQFVEPV